MNHSLLVEALEKAGWVVDTGHANGNGWPDAVASKWQAMQGTIRVPEYHLITRLVEFKTEKGHLTQAQQAFHARHNVVVIRTIEQAVNLR